MMKYRIGRRDRFGFVLALGLLMIWVWINPAMASEPGGPPDYYPEKFDGVARIGVMSDDDIVIGDGRFTLASSVTFATPSSRYAGRGPFRVGTLVGYLLDGNGEIQSLWLLKPAR